jgi:hypothetical protein
LAVAIGRPAVAIRYRGEIVLDTRRIYGKFGILHKKRSASALPQTVHRDAVNITGGNEMKRSGFYGDSLTVTCTALLAFTIAGGVVTSAKADDNMRSSPPDTTSYSRPAVAEDFDPLNAAGTADPGKAVQFDVFVVDTVVNNTDPDLKITDTFNDGEVSVAVKPQHPNQLVMTAFSGSWGLRAPLWRSSNRGNTWTKEFTVNPPPGVAGVPGCPCDQTVDYTTFKDLAGAFLTFSPTNIYSALNRNPAALTFNYFESPPGVAQATNHLDGVNDVD